MPSILIAAPAAPENPAVRLVDDRKGSPFSQELARQQSAAQDSARPANPPQVRPATGEMGKDSQAAADELAAADGAATRQVDREAAAQEHAAALPLLPQQALDIAAQAAAVQAQSLRAAASPAAAIQTPATRVADPATLPAAAPASALSAGVLLTTPLPAVQPPAPPQSAQPPQPATLAALRPAGTALRPTPEARLSESPRELPTASAAPYAAPDAQSVLTAALATASPQTRDTTLTDAASADAVLRTDAESAAAPRVVAVFNIPSRQDIAVTSSTLPATAPLALHVATPVSSQAAWGAALGRQVVMLSSDAHHGPQTAELRLDPPDLGPLRVTLSVHDGVASASFVSAHAAVRHAVEAALPQLQQALAQAGISLGQANVGEQSNPQGFDAESQQQGESQRQADGQAPVASAREIAHPSTPPARATDALVDTFA